MVAPLFSERPSMSRPTPSGVVVLAVLVSATAVGPLSMNIFVPSMPGLQRALSASYGAVQLTLSLYLIAFAAAQLLYGPISDRWGRRPVLLAGLAIFVAASAACAFAPNIEVLIAGRLVQAIGACAGMVLSRAVVRDLYDRDRAASMIAYITMAMMAAPMLAPGIGGYLDEWFGWRSGFVFVGVAGLIVLAAATALLGETHPPSGTRVRLGTLFWSFGHLLRKPAFLGYALQLGFTAVSFFSFLGGAPYVMVHILHRPPSEYGLYFFFAAGMYMIGNFITGRMSRRWGIDRLIVAGLLISLVAAAAQAVLYVAGMVSPLTLFAAMGGVGFGHGLSIPNGLAGAVSVDPERAGAASGLAGFLQMGSGAAASYVVGLAIGETAAPVVIGMLAGAALAAAAYFAARSVVARQRPQQAHERKEAAE